MQVWRFLLSALLAIVLVGAQCTKPRVRRAWTALSATDRQLYKEAIATAMDSGAYIKFIEVHTEMMSEREAHRQCMFVYWHRRLLAAFENMLRGQGPKFACVTIPYWDWVSDYAKFATGTCPNLLACSPSLGFLGGRAGVPRHLMTMSINGMAVDGSYCDAVAPLNHFCESSRVANASCGHCIPRDDWSRASFPASASFASVRAQLFGAANIGGMSTAVEQGVHNNIHAELGATMATFSSPADPIFWSHHATIDALHSIFHKCRVGEQRLTMADNAASVDWTSCRRRNGNGTVFQPTDEITMRTGFMGSNATNATRDPLVGPFFSAVPQRFVALVDIRDLGTSSYSYELQGLLGSLYSDCGATNGITTTRSPSEEQDQAESSGQTPPTMGALLNTTTDPVAQQLRRWIHATDVLITRRGGNAVLEAEQLACLFQDECLGGVTTYTPEFKARFGLTTEPRCKQIIDRIYRRVDVLKLTEWKAQMIQTFGCPTPKRRGPETDDRS